MHWASVHKAISVLGLLVIGWLVVLELLLSQDDSGLKLFEGNILFHSVVVLFYVISITGFVTGYQYAALQRKKSKLFWVSVVCLILTGLITVPSAYEDVNHWVQPPSRNIFDGLHLFEISENRKMLNKQQHIGMPILALLQLISLVTLVRLRKLFAADS
jgi:hypothetical protein